MSGAPLRLLVRADAGGRMGWGHVMRCLALAQAWRDSDQPVTWAAAALPEPLARRLAGEEISLARIPASPGSDDDARALRSLADECAVVVVDGYHLGAGHRRAAHDAGAAVLVVDDAGGAGPWQADWVLNQNPYASAALYPGPASGTSLLLGPRYLLLRREFARFQNWRRRVRRRVQQILVTMGGSDPTGASAIVAQAIAGLEALPRAVFMVPDAPGAEERRMEILSHLPSAEVVDPGLDVAGRMADADVAISGGGSTCLELAHMQVPTLATVVADNQRPVIAVLVERGVVRSLGDSACLRAPEIQCALEALASDRGARESMAWRGREVAPAGGAHRVVAAIRERLEGHG